MSELSQGEESLVAEDPNPMCFLYKAGAAIKIPVELEPQYRKMDWKDTPQTANPERIEPPPLDVVGGGSKKKS